jgi:hypothetical protein
MRDTIELARMAGFQTGKRDYADGSSTYPFVVSVATGNFLVELKAFEALVRADEREACAKVCDDKHDTWRWDDEADSASGPRDCAAAIRARGETK